MNLFYNTLTGRLLATNFSSPSRASLHHIESSQSLTMHVLFSTLLHPQLIKYLIQIPNLWTLDTESHYVVKTYGIPENKGQDSSG